MPVEFTRTIELKGNYKPVPSAKFPLFDIN